MTDDSRPPGNSTPGTPPPPPPPNLAPPASSGAYGEQSVRSTSRIGGLARALGIVMLIIPVVTLVIAVLSSGAASDAEDYLAGDLSEDDFESAVQALSAAQLLSGVLLAAAAVLSIVWMYRLANNVRAHGRSTTWHPLFSVFGWMLPPVLYVIPVLMLRELWKASDPTDVDGTDRWKRGGESLLLWGWFALFGVYPAIMLVVEVGSLASTGLPSGDMELLAESLEDFGVIGWLTALVNMGAAALWFLFVRQLTARHVRLTGES